MAFFYAQEEVIYQFVLYGWCLTDSVIFRPKKKEMCFVYIKIFYDLLLKTPYQSTERQEKNIMLIQVL